MGIIRNIFRNILGMIIIVILFWTNCAKNPIDTNTTNDIIAVKGILNVSELGEGPFKVYSSFNPNPISVQDTNFTILAPIKKNLLVAVTDEKDSLRGISVVVNGNNGPVVYPVGIESTLLSIILLSPGVSALQLDSLNIVLERIRQLPVYSEFYQYVSQNFNIALAQLVQTNTFQYYLRTIIKQYFDNYKQDSLANAPGGALTNVWEKNKFEVVKFTKENVLTNYGWRFVAVWRTDHYSQSENKSMLNEVMSGATGFSFASLLKWTWNHGTRLTDNSYQETNDLLASKYHIYGPGFKYTYETTDYDNPRLWAYTIGYYAVWPIISLLGGNIKNDVVQFIIDVVDLIWDTSDLNEDVERLRNEPNDQNRMEFARDIGIKILKAIISNTPQFSGLAQLLSVIEASITAGNFFAIVYTLGTLQPYCTITIYLKSTTENSLIAYYPFNGNANDESGYGYHGQVNGAILTSDRFGNPNSAYFFDGIDDYIQIPSDALNDLPQGSISAWVKAESLNRLNGIIDKTETYNTNYFQLVVANNNRFRVNIDVHYGELLRMYSNTVVEKNRWYHVVVTWDGTEWKIFVNGQLETQETRNRSVPDAIRPVLIGNVDGNRSPFHGVIDDIRIYNYVLSETEINQLYHENGW